MPVYCALPCRLFPRTLPVNVGSFDHTFDLVDFAFQYLERTKRRVRAQRAKCRGGGLLETELTGPLPTEGDTRVT
jgi:hypothetical protein